MAVDTGAYLTLIDPDTAKFREYSEADSIGKMKVSSPIGEEHGCKVRVKKSIIRLQALVELICARDLFQHL